MDGEKLERLVAGHRERAVRNVTNVDPGGARLERDRLALRRDGGGAAYDINGLFAGMRVQDRDRARSRFSTQATESDWGM
jgi:hypothetical protein